MFRSMSKCLNVRLPSIPSAEAIAVGSIVVAFPCVVLANVFETLHWHRTASVFGIPGCIAVLMALISLIRTWRR